jgi:hypothetical protein
MRHRTIGCVLAALLGLGLVWPGDVAAQRRPTNTRQVSRAVPRPVRSVRPVYRRYYYPSRYYSPYSWYWGLGWGSWYPYGRFYGAYGYPYWSGYGPWGPYPAYPYHPYYYDNYASVRVQGSPREAQVFVDGYFVGVVDDFDGVFQRLRLPPGGHEITLHLTGYRNASERMYLQPRSTYHLRTRLEALPQGSPQEPPPAPNPDAVRSDEYERPDRQPDEAEPEGPPSRRWPPREQAEEREAARAARESRFGTLTLRVQPPDAEVSIDGAPWRGAVDEEGMLSIQVPAGTHRIEIRREGYVSYIADVNVRANVATPLNVMLQQPEN